MKRMLSFALVLALVIPAIPVNAQQRTALFYALRAEGHLAPLHRGRDAPSFALRDALPPCGALACSPLAAEGPIARAARLQALATPLAAAVTQESSRLAALREQARRISAGAKVIVTMLTGEKIHGTLLEVRESEILVSRPRDRGYDVFGNKVHDATPAGEVALPFENIRSIKKPLSGRMIGAIVGAVVGGLMLAAVIQGDMLES